MWSNLSSEVRMQQPGAKEIAEIIKLEEHGISMLGGGIDDEEVLGPFRLAAASIKTRLVRATQLLDKVDEKSGDAARSRQSTRMLDNCNKERGTRTRLRCKNPPPCNSTAIRD